MLGLTTVHLILKAVEVLHPGIGGDVEIWLDCLGVLFQVSDLALPPQRIPKKYKCSGIMKIYKNNTTERMTLQTRAWANSNVYSSMT